MNRILFDEASPGYQLNPRDPRFDHVRGVLRMGVGDAFDIGVINGPAGKGRITELSDTVLAIEAEWGDQPPLPPPVHLLVGMCRPATARRILTTAPTLGVRQITFVPTGRSDPAYARSSLWRDAEWRRCLLDGVEQAFDTHLPVVNRPDSLEEALVGLSDGLVRLALDVYEGTEPLSGCQFEAGASVCLAIGPERGWAAKDRKLLVENGFKLVSLHERVLRVETAVVVGLTLLLAGMGEL